MRPVCEAARAYLALGWRILSIPFRQKRPILPDWPNLEVDAASLGDAFPTGAPSNIGVVLGAVSGGLADIDLDCAEAIELAPLVLPNTWTFGRASKPRSHWLYVVEGGARMRRYVDGRETMVELRSGRAEDKRVQTVLPPSTHPSGEAVDWTEDADGTEGPRRVTAAELEEAVQKLAVACLFVRRGKPKQEVVAWLIGMADQPRGDVELMLAVNRLRGVVPSIVHASRAARGKSESFDAAVAAYNAAHVYDWPRSGGQCPVCQHRGCFGSFSDSRRWTCHSTGHPAGVGVGGEGCYTGDALDIDAWRQRKTRLEVLKEGGYL